MMFFFPALPVKAAVSRESTVIINEKGNYQDNKIAKEETGLSEECNKEELTGDTSWKNEINQSIVHVISICLLFWFIAGVIPKLAIAFYFG